MMTYWMSHICVFLSTVRELGVPITKHFCTLTKHLWSDVRDKTGFKRCTIYLEYVYRFVLCCLVGLPSRLIVNWILCNKLQCRWFTQRYLSKRRVMVGKISSIFRVQRVTSNFSSPARDTYAVLGLLQDCQWGLWDRPQSTGGWVIYLKIGCGIIKPYALTSVESCNALWAQLTDRWEILLGPLLLTWFNFNPSMDK